MSLSLFSACIAKEVQRLQQGAVLALDHAQESAALATQKAFVHVMAIDPYDPTISKAERETFARNRVQLRENLLQDGDTAGPYAQLLKYFDTPERGSIGRDTVDFLAGHGFLDPWKHIQEVAGDQTASTGATVFNHDAIFHAGIGLGGHTIEEEEIVQAYEFSYRFSTEKLLPYLTQMGLEKEAMEAVLLDLVPAHLRPNDPAFDIKKPEAWKAWKKEHPHAMMQIDDHVLATIKQDFAAVPMARIYDGSVSQEDMAARSTVVAFKQLMHQECTAQYAEVDQQNFVEELLEKVDGAYLTWLQNRDEQIAQQVTEQKLSIEEALQRVGGDQVTYGYGLDQQLMRDFPFSSASPEKMDAVLLDAIGGRQTLRTELPDFVLDGHEVWDSLLDLPRDKLFGEMHANYAFISGLHDEAPDIGVDERQAEEQRILKQSPKGHLAKVLEQRDQLTAQDVDLPETPRDIVAKLIKEREVAATAQARASSFVKRITSSDESPSVPERLH